MGHYAFLDENNVVTEVIVGRNEDEVVDGISDWEAHYGEIRNQLCKRTSFNMANGIHHAGKEPFRYNYAGIGFTFDPTKGTHGAFIPPQPFPSWTLNNDTCNWEPPVPRPTVEDSDTYKWDEESQSWIQN